MKKESIDTDIANGGVERLLYSKYASPNFFSNTFPQNKYSKISAIAQPLQ
ncbi:MAG: hypothetical protein K0Q85_1649 [Caproiciproducens sp.]|jgi:hypothetical protein|nr:hypothetical protein [Caproiciproducens sp.]